MSVIVAMIHDEQVWLGADSFESNNCMASLRKERKFWRMTEPESGEDLLIGSVGSARYGDLIRYSLQVPANTRGVDALNYLNCEFSVAVRDVLREGAWLKNDCGKETCDSAALIAFQGRLFVLASDFSVEESTRTYRALGSGEDAAMGALYASRDRIDPEQLLHTAMEAAADTTDSVSAPFFIEKL